MYRSVCVKYEMIQIVAIKLSIVIKASKILEMGKYQKGYYQLINGQEKKNHRWVHVSQELCLVNNLIDG